MLSSEADLLLVIPAYCEHERLPPFLNELVREFQSSQYKVHILIVDDGSPSSSKRLLWERIKLGTYTNCTVGSPISLGRNGGKGAAVLHGWRSGIDARFNGFVDADGAVSASEVSRLCSLALSDPTQRACIFATRIKMLGQKINRRAPRHIAGRLFSTLVNALFRLDAYDTQCGCKIIPREIFATIDSLLVGAGLCFDVELILALQRTNAIPREIPIDWVDKGGGQVKVWKHGPRMLMQIFSIFFRARRWKEQAKAPTARGTP